MSELDPGFVDDLVALRHRLHRHAEVSDHEETTPRLVEEFLAERAAPDEIIRGLGGAGLAAVYHGAAEGPTVLLRAELDALPINESTDLPYRSSSEGAAHKCGHDGHMTMVVGAGIELARAGLDRGRLVLLFQPAEETGQGAHRVLEDPGFGQLRPDWAFALHNLPEEPLGGVVVRPGSFSAASSGAVIRLVGATSHAAFPEEGRSPARAVATLLGGLSELPRTVEVAGDFALVTVIHARLGEIAFGTSPGEAVVMATLRSDRDDTVELLRGAVRRLARETAEAEGLRYEVTWTEDFPATVNHPDAAELVADAAREVGAPLIGIGGPYRWSEDFGWLLRDCRGALFGLGSGVRHPPLHSPDYDFPDELIPLGVRIFRGVVTRLLGAS